MQSSSLEITILRAQHEASEATAHVIRARERITINDEGFLLAQEYRRSDGAHVDAMTLSTSVPTLLSHISKPWDTSLYEWYRGVRPYTRRELAADAVVHGLGLLFGAGVCFRAHPYEPSPMDECSQSFGHVSVPQTFVATVVGAIRQYSDPFWRFTRHPPLLVSFAIAIYGASLLAMFICSALFNVGQRVWRPHTETLALLDHIGICLLIAGSATPVLAFACCFRSSVVLWCLMILTIVAKWSGGCLDNIALHVVSFVLGPLITTLTVLEDVSVTLDPWQLDCVWWAGAFYVGGLLPWGIRALEFHVAIWHVCVLVASALVFALVYVEVDTPEKVAALEAKLVRCLAQPR